MDILQSEGVRVLRGVILRMVYDNHRKQQSHLSAIVLAGALVDGLHFELPLNELFAVLQDLRDRRLLSFVEEHNRWTGHVSIQYISITPDGRDLVERTTRHPAVQFD